MRLLIVDDNPQMRTILGSVLKAVGVRHLGYAQNGQRALEAIAKFRPDLCYVDCEMPVMNGLDFTSAVRALENKDRFLPIIMITGHSTLTHLTIARDRGVNEFLCKPVTSEMIVRRLEAVIFRPRRFIQSTGYFGPDRRRRNERHSGPFRRSDDPGRLGLLDTQTREVAI